MQIAITGATGQIGSALILELIQAGHQVRALVHQHTFGMEKLPVTLIRGSVLNQDDCNRLCEGADIVFHLAAIVSINGDPDGKVWNTNVNGTRNILEACLGHQVNKLIHFSSIHAFSTVAASQLMDESVSLAADTAFAYDRSKSAAQKLVLEYVRQHKLNACILNPTGVFGFPDYLPSVKGRLFINLYKGKIPVLIPGGFDWVDVRDVVKSAMTAIEHGKAGEAYILSGQYVTMSGLTQIIGTITGKKMPKIVLPFWLLYSVMPFIQLYSKLSKTEPLYTAESLAAVKYGHPNINNSKARTQLGHTVRPLEHTIRDTYDWLKKNQFIT